ncbi:hypothetical protein C8R44DRAFT_980736 [Mycena epipterygia]|nr:hypothetical protein C8R44DRAFT_980736 [Mycena epipterygia]
MRPWPNGIPANYPYFIADIPGLYPNQGVHEHLPVPFFEFRGVGAPPSDVGSPGDVYIDLTPSAHALYSKSEEDWTKWAGPGESADMLAHPHFVDCRSARYVWFNRDIGVEWVCARTVARRQLSLRSAGILNFRHVGAQACLALASQIIGNYLTEEDRASLPALKLTPVKHDTSASSKTAMDSESESEDLGSDSELSDTFYPSKKARLLASTNSQSATPAAKSPASSRRARTDRETLQLEKDLVALRADKELRSLRTRKRQLMASIEESTERGRDSSFLQTLEKGYNNCYPSPSATPVTAAEAKQILPELRCRVDEIKKHILVTRFKRFEAEKQLAERLQLCNEIRERHQ